MIGFKFRSSLLGDHMHVRVFVRKTSESTWQLTGNLVMDAEDYRAFKEIVAMAQTRMEVEFEESQESVS